MFERPLAAALPGWDYTIAGLTRGTGAPVLLIPIALGGNTAATKKPPGRH